MQPGDKIVRATGEIAELRFVLTDVADSANTIADYHGARAFTRVMLGEAMVAALLLASRLKGNGTVQTLFRFSGEVTLARADATPLGLVRAMIPADEIRNAAEFEPLLLPRLITVRKLDERGAAKSEGIVEMPGLKMGESVAYYLRQSEQVRAFADIRSSVDAEGRLAYCAGYMIEAFPKVEGGTLDTVAERSRRLPGFKAFAGEGKLDLPALLAALAGPIEHKIHLEIPVRDYCPCSPESVRKALSGLGREELEDIALNNEETELFCEFCRQRYLVSSGQIRKILDNLGDGWT